MLRLGGRLGIPLDRLAGIDRTRQQAVLVGLAEAELGELVAQRGGAREELERVPLVADDLVLARQLRFVEQAEFVQGVRVVLVGPVGGPLEPDQRVAQVRRLAQEPFQQDHAHFVHGGHVAEGGGPLVPLHGFDGIFSRAPAVFGTHLAADCGSVGAGCVTGFGGGLVEGECFFGIDLQPQRTLAITVGQVELRVGEALRRQLLDFLVRIEDVALAIFVAGFGIGATTFAREDGGGFNELFGKLQT